jgi:hypothetical protein
MEEEMAAAGEAPQHGTSPLDKPSALVSGLRWRRVFPGEGSQLGVLRRWLKSLLPECPARDDVACVANELATNAVVHTASGHGGWFAVEITWHRAVVRVAVADCGAPGGPRMIDDPAGEHGRGLLVVRSLSVRTGVCGDRRGRLVWADVPWGNAGAAEPASPQDPYEAAILDGQAGLASRFAGVPAWFGRSTLQWWALTAGGLVTAPSAEELASVLGDALDPPSRWPLPAPGLPSAEAGAARVADREQRPAVSAPRFQPSRAQPFGLRTRVQPAVV